MVANGTYANFLSPAVNGSANARITYVGILANPAAVVITPNGVLSKTDDDQGHAAHGGFDITGVRDSIADCIAFGSRSNIFRRRRLHVLAHDRELRALLGANGLRLIRCPSPSATRSWTARST